MENMSIAVFAGDSLLLSELIGSLESRYPVVNLSIYASGDFLPAIAADKPAYETKDIKDLQDEEIIIVLSDPGQAAEAIRKLDASIIDCTGVFSDYDDVYPVFEPVEYIAGHFEGDKSSVRGSLLLPAALFGKNGIDDLLSQTRNLFSFGRDKSKVFEERVAFNVLFGGDDPDNILSGYKKRLEEQTGMSLNFRIVPVSTVFVADFFFGERVSFDKGELFYDYESPSAADAMEADGIGILGKAPEGMLSFTGDYIKVLSSQILLRLKEITGE